MAENIEDVYKVNGHQIQVKAEVVENSSGAYFANVKYREHKPKNDGYDNYWMYDFDDKLGPWKEAQIPLNGPGKSKLEKKIGKFLKPQFRQR
jgi:hypothetical protein